MLQKKITDWRINCSFDKDKIINNYPSYIFKTSKNYCKGGTFHQRAEIRTKKGLSLWTKAKYDFQTIFTVQDNNNNFYTEKFDIFQIHDARYGYAPPLKLNIQSTWILRLYSDYKTGPWEKC